MIVTQDVPIFDYTSWETKLSELSNQFKDAQPFPHIVLDNFIETSAANILAEVFKESKENWYQYHHFNSTRGAAHRDRYQVLPQALEVLEEFHSEQMLQFLSQLTGIHNLFSDPSFEGGGFMNTERGGRLNIHSDFLSHPYKKKWHRKLNLLLYLNPDWKEAYGGHLELWNKNMTKANHRILPLFNRCVIFQTSKHSYHGFPEAIKCPQELSRQCLGLYYYTENSEETPSMPTRYRSRPQDSPRTRWAIEMDNKLLHGYVFLKRSLGITDAFANRLMRLFSR